MSKQDVSLDLRDATEPLKYIIHKGHVWGSHSKTGKILGPCIQEQALLDKPGVLDAKVERTVARVIFKGNKNVARRYSLSQDGKKIAEINDRLGKKGLLAELKDPLELWLLPPRRNRSLKYLRSPEMKAIRRKSAAERKGLPKGKYNNPTKRGFRNGSGRGRAHIWSKEA